MSQIIEFSVSILLISQSMAPEIQLKSTGYLTKCTCPIAHNMFFTSVLNNHQYASTHSPTRQAMYVEHKIEVYLLWKSNTYYIF